MQFGNLIESKSIIWVSYVQENEVSLYMTSSYWKQSYASKFKLWELSALVQKHLRELWIVLWIYGSYKCMD